MSDAVSSSPSNPEDVTLMVGGPSAPTASATTFGPGDDIGRYLVLAEAGRGGMGQVLRAYDPKLRREVALKLVRLDTGSQGDAQMLAEAQAMAKLSHPNVVPVYDVDTAGGLLFIAMEYVAGQTLRAWLRDRPRPWRQVLSMFIAAGRGLAAAHDAGLVHRDFKPDNVLVGDDGRARVTDFGLALPRDPRNAPDLDVSARDADHTASTVVMGTPGYMAPEQHRCDGLTPASDQYSFCVALFEGLYSTRPFQPTDAEELYEAKVRSEIRRPSGSALLPGRVHRALVRGLAAKPEARWPTMDALLDALERGRDARRRVVLGVAGVGVVAGAMVWSGARERPSCQDSDAAIRAVWNEQSSQAVQAALSSTQTTYAESTAQRVQSGLDAYAGAWSAARHDACEATVVRHEQSDELLDLRMLCLDRRLSAFSTLVDVLEDADEEVFRRAATAVASLQSVDECSDRQRLLATVPPPAGTEREDVETIRNDLARSNALSSAGKYDEAAEVANDALGRARTIDYPPVVAEALVNLAWRVSMKGDYEQAREMMREGYFTALGVDHVKVAAVAASRLVFLEGVRLQHHDAALEWAAHARALLEVGLNSPVTKAHLLYHIGATHTGTGNATEGEPFLREAIAIVEDQDPVDLDALANYNNALGQVLHMEGKYAEASSLYRRSIELYEEISGAGHPTIAAPLTNLASSEFFLGHRDEAIALVEQAIAIQRDTFGPEHPKVALSLANLAAMHTASDRPAEALEYQKQSIAIYEQSLGTDHPFYAQALGNTGMILGDLGRLEEGRDYLERAVAQSHETLGDADYRTAQMHDGLGSIYLQLGRHDDARREFETALELMSKSVGPDNSLTSQPKLNLGRLEAALGDFESSETRLREALALLQSSDRDPSRRALVEFELAKTLWELGRAGESRTTAEQALERLEGAPQASPSETAKVETWLRSHGG